MPIILFLPTKLLSPFIRRTQRNHQETTGILRNQSNAFWCWLNQLLLNIIAPHSVNPIMVISLIHRLASPASRSTVKTLPGTKPLLLIEAVETKVPPPAIAGLVPACKMELKLLLMSKIIDEFEAMLLEMTLTALRVAALGMTKGLPISVVAPDNCPEITQTGVIPTPVTEAADISSRVDRKS